MVPRTSVDSSRLLHLITLKASNGHWKWVIFYRVWGWVAVWNWWAMQRLFCWLTESSWAELNWCSSCCTSEYILAHTKTRAVLLGITLLLITIVVVLWVHGGYWVGVLVCSVLQRTSQPAIANDANMARRRRVLITGKQAHEIDWQTRQRSWEMWERERSTDLHWTSGLDIHQVGREVAHPATKVYNNCTRCWVLFRWL